MQASHTVIGGEMSAIHGSNLTLAATAAATLAIGSASCSGPAAPAPGPAAQPAVSPAPPRAATPRPADNPWLTPTIARRCFRFCAFISEECGRRGSGDCGRAMVQCVNSCFDLDRLKQAAQARAPAGWGSSKQSAINTCLPPGVKLLMQDLRCSGGAKPRFHRVGSVGSRSPRPGTVTSLQMDWTRPLKPQEPDHHIVDHYQLQCGAHKTSLYLDLYHCADGPAPWNAPSGFTRPVPAPDKITRRLRQMGVGTKKVYREPPPARSR